MMIIKSSDKHLKSIRYAFNNLMVGDMPQKSYVGGLTLKPIKGLRVQGLYRYYTDHYSDWSPDAREIEDGDPDVESSK